jgi:hypothetical protein
LPLYRRIAPPELRGLYFAGFVDAPGGLLPVVESQGQWIAAVLTGRLRLPPPERMWHAIERAERRSRERFPNESPRSVRCDPHAYRRLLHADLRRARRTVWHAATASRVGKEAAVRPVPPQGEQPAGWGEVEVMAMEEKASWRDTALGVERELDVPQGRLRYFEAGTGPRSSLRTGLS